MNEQTRIKISALIDNEVGDDELARLGQEIAASDALRELCGRYQLIGDALRGEKVDPGFLRVADLVRAQLADEPTVLAPPRRNWTGPWLKPAAGAAVAASVLAAAVLLLPPVTGPQLAPQPVAALKQPPGQGGYAGVGGTRWDLGKPAVQSKLNGYLVNHRNRAPSANMQGMIPYASFVAYDQER
jgi:sigma-E factor negative regulatory protein RseA